MLFHFKSCVISILTVCVNARHQYQCQFISFVTCVFSFRPTDRPTDPWTCVVGADPVTFCPTLPCPHFLASRLTRSLVPSLPQYLAKTLNSA